MTKEGPEIVGSGSSYYASMGEQQYAAKINTPAKSPEYFDQFHKPMLERLKQKFGTPIGVLDVACGPAFELEFFTNDPDVILFASDISPDILPQVQARLPQAHLFAMDASKSVLADNIVEMGMLVNAMIYVPADMLKTMYGALKPGGEAALNFRVFSNPHNKAFYDYYTTHGGVITEKPYTIETPEGSKTFTVQVLDYTACVKDDGTPDTDIRQLGEQMYFENIEDVQALLDASGFEVLEHSLFNFSSPVNPDNQVDVFVLKKPE
ncbi:class I SAM-dependent methyltransferase [Patescibacteria group bacterium]|nr:class I SAM-dependent methyltransferase [Patescibacteria group bacterium]